MNSSASLGIPPELPAANGSLLGNDGGVRLPLAGVYAPAFGRTEAPRALSRPHRFGFLPNLPVHRPGNPPCGLSARSAALY